MIFNLGIISGSGSLPIQVAEAHNANGGQCYIACLEGYSETERFARTNYNSFKIGDVGAMLEFFKKNNVSRVVLAGKVSRPNFGNIKVDFVGASLLAKILKAKILGDDSVLQIITKFIEAKGYKVISANDIIRSSSLPIQTLKKPDVRDLTDIELGIKVTQAIGRLDIGQAVIVDEGYVIGVEAAEGTDNLIKRCSDLRKSRKGGVLVKMMKVTQDKRLDIPTIGPETIELLAMHNYKGVAIEKDNVIIVEMQESVRLADLHKIFIIEI